MATESRQSHRDEGNGMSKGLLIGLLAGGALGASIALLYAPKPGRRLRAEIKNKVGDLVDQGEEYLSTVQEKASEIVTDAKRGITQLFTDTEKEVARSVRSAAGSREE